MKQYEKDHITYRKEQEKDEKIKAAIKKMGKNKSKQQPTKEW